MRQSCDTLLKDFWKCSVSSLSENRWKVSHERLIAGNIQRQIEDSHPSDTITVLEEYRKDQCQDSISTIFTPKTEIGLKHLILRFPDDRKVSEKSRRAMFSFMLFAHTLFIVWLDCFKEQMGYSVFVSFTLRTATYFREFVKFPT